MYCLCIVVVFFGCGWCVDCVVLVLLVGWCDVEVFVECCCEIVGCGEVDFFGDVVDFY